MSKRRRAATGRKTIRSRDLTALQAIRDGRRDRAATFTDRRKEQARTACRKRPQSDHE